MSDDHEEMKREDIGTYDRAASFYDANTAGHPMPDGAMFAFEKKA